MKTFHLLIKQLEQWGRQCRKLGLFSPRRTKPPRKDGKAQFSPSLCSSRRSKGKLHPLVTLTLVIVVLTVVVGDRFYDRPELKEGTVSGEKIYAPEDGEFIDWQTTQERRDRIRRGTVPIIKQDSTITEQIEGEVVGFLEQVEQVRQIAGSFPFLNGNIISVSTQKYLRQSSDSSWQTILTAVENESYNGLSEVEPEQVDFALQQAIAELLIYRQQVPEQTFREAMTTINLARQNYSLAQQELLPEQGTKAYRDKIAFLELEAEVWQETKKAIEQALERILVQGIPEGLTSEAISQIGSVQLQYDVPPETKSLALDLLTGVLRPNLTEDWMAMRLRAEQAAEKVEDTVVSIKKGELIVDKGEKISREDFVLLDNFGLSRRGINWQGLGLSVIVVGTVVGVFGLIVWRGHRPMRLRDQILLCLLSASAPLLVVFQIPYTNLSAIGLLSSSFYGPILALVQVSFVSGLVLFTSETPSWEYLLAGIAGSIVAALIAGRLRSREELALLGAGVGLVQGLVYLIVYLFVSPGARWWNVLLPSMAACSLSGVVWSIVALGISPYLERLFDLVTPIRLAELSNPNRPLLKKLATEAPGTFQHTMFVASLAEAAARELHCNVELVRAGTLYHDIGKMHDPKGFIENQMGGPNKHDQIDDPWQSVDIIKKHVSEGLVLARKHGLPQAIRDFIPEHQGKMLISYFYFQAKERAAKENKQVLESDFRYDGPIPQSRETGMVMLADGCEAALRSLKDASPEQALIMVEKIFKARWRENELVDSGLKKKELKTIARIFVQVWQQYNHKRIAYPKAALEPQKNASSINN